ncbi:MAG: 16S rRNA (cytidine(1402)-2'-O)-methyltransferase [Patescibacteria group bacterium]|jgi:16S rRNA (cytidine1402-2'-O)-methyltransferase
MMGKIYVVATPIGNLGDITLRALETLRTVDLIAAEDTRTSKKLLNHYNIGTPLISYHQHSRDNKLDYLVEQLVEGKNIALITDAGTPGIQDPAGRLVGAARAAGAEVMALPGPSALTAALSIAGESADNFIFLGFLPKKKGRETLFKKISGWDLPILIYESPMRVGRTLRDIEKFLGQRKILAFRELTKKFEEVKIGETNELINYFASKLPKGEFVIMILPAASQRGKPAQFGKTSR